MNRGDELIEKGAARLRELAEKAAAQGGLGARLAQPLAEDAEFLRKLKPSLVAARARGEPVTDQRPTPVAAPSGPQVGKRPKPPGSGPNPFVVVAAALALGILIAKTIDWRSHAHPRD